MTGFRDPSSAFKDIATMKWRDASNTLRTAAQVYMRDSGGLAPVFSPMSVTVYPAYANGSVYSVGAPRATTNSVTATAAGGTAPYSVEWTFTEAGWEAINPTLLTTAFRSPSLPPSDPQFTTITCTLTDAHGATASFDFPGTANNEYSGP